MSGDGGGGGHGRADEMGAAARPLTALEVAVAGAGRALAGLELVGVHGQAHAASRLPPFGAGLLEDAVQAFRLGLVSDRLAAGHDQGLHACGRLSSFEDLGCRPTRALQRLRAVALDAAQAKLLNLAVGSPALAIERRAFLDDGRVVEFTRSLYRGDAYDFVAELHAD